MNTLLTLPLSIPSLPLVIFAGGASISSSAVASFLFGGILASYTVIEYMYSQYHYALDVFMFHNFTSDQQFTS